jgi:hypothetical protein
MIDFQPKENTKKKKIWYTYHNNTNEKSENQPNPISSIDRIIFDHILQCSIRNV